jgi:single-stranded DNA-binding protein
MPLYVSGRMRTTKYTTAEGTDKYFYEVLANRIRFVTEDNVNRE